MLQHENLVSWFEPNFDINYLLVKFYAITICIVNDIGYMQVINIQSTYNVWKDKLVFYS